MSPHGPAFRVIVIAGLLAAGVPGARAQPAVPEIPLEQFPETPRRVIGQAVGEARAHPGDPARMGRLAMLLHAWEQFETAAAVYASARGLEPRFEWFYLGGLVEYRLAHYEAATRLLGAAVKMAPGDLPAELAYGDALLAAGNADEALAVYRPLTSGPGAPHARYGVGRALAARGDAAGALRELDQALGLYPEFGEGAWTRGGWRCVIWAEWKRRRRRLPRHGSSAHAGPASRIRSWRRSAHCVTTRTPTPNARCRSTAEAM